MLDCLILPQALRAQLAAGAAAAYPRECCGLIEGIVEGGTASALALHPCANLAVEADRFEIDPAAQFALFKSLRGTERSIIGCYHSHPNGVAEPSPRDLASAGEEGFVWLIQALDAKGCYPPSAFVSERCGFRALIIAVPASPLVGEAVASMASAMRGD